MYYDPSHVSQVYRVYYDRLVDAKDRNWLFELLKNMVKNHFKEDFAAIFKHLSPSGKITDDDMRSLMFGDYIHPDSVSNGVGWRLSGAVCCPLIFYTTCGCSCVYLYVCTTCLHACVYMCVRTCVCVCVCVHVCIHVCVHCTCVHVCVHV